MKALEMNSAEVVLRVLSPIFAQNKILRTASIQFSRWPRSEYTVTSCPPQVQKSKILFLAGFGEEPKREKWVPLWTAAVKAMRRCSTLRDIRVSGALFDWTKPRFAQNINDVRFEPFNRHCDWPLLEPFGGPGNVLLRLTLRPRMQLRSIFVYLRRRFTSGTMHR